MEFKSPNSSNVSSSNSHGSQDLSYKTPDKSSQHPNDGSIKDESESSSYADDSGLHDIRRSGTYKRIRESKRKKSIMSVVTQKKPRERRNTMAISMEDKGRISLLLKQPELLKKTNISADDMEDSFLTSIMSSDRPPPKVEKKIGKFDRMVSVFGLEDFSIFYSSAPSNEDSRCIIMSNNGYKILWDLWILLLLLLISVVVPWRLAFYDESDHGWQITYWVIDSFFFLDIILTFFTSVTDE